jgi:hypothetical protein
LKASASVLERRRAFWPTAADLRSAMKSPAIAGPGDVRVEQWHSRPPIPAMGRATLQWDVKRLRAGSSRVSSEPGRGRESLRWRQRLPRAPRGRPSHSTTIGSLVSSGCIRADQARPTAGVIGPSPHHHENRTPMSPLTLSAVRVGATAWPASRHENPIPNLAFPEVRDPILGEHGAAATKSFRSPRRIPS